MSDTRKFAYGADRIDGTKCPASAAGFDPKSGDESLMAAEAYDEAVRQLMGPDSDYEGVLPEEKAREAWIAAVGRVQDPEPAREVARTLGWL